MVSYSTLLSLDRQIKGLPKELDISEKTLELGRQLHLRALQPDVYDPDKDEFYSITSQMIKSLQRNSIFNKFMQFIDGKSEHIYYWTCKFTGIKCQAKVDRKIPDNILDLKTTSCKSQPEFEASIDAYNYDMQGAFYLDGSKYNYFYIIGIQKRFPFNTFTFKFERDSMLIKQGREKYLTIINESIEKEFLLLNKIS